MAPALRLSAIEGFYGPPLPHDERLALVRWLATVGYDAYVYAPKNDPFHRERWREPYPPNQQVQLQDLVACGREAGIEVGLAISPGLDWRAGSDESALVAKLTSFRELGARSLAIAWDDVPPGGAQLGEAHGRAVAAAVAALGADVAWFTCPTDYATAEPTEYLRRFAACLPEDVPILWTGPSIVSPEVPRGMARALGDALARPLVFGENFPVNDGLMGGVLHLGPYPARPPELVDEVAGAAINFMSLPNSSRIGLELAARWWRDPTGDREVAWGECIEHAPGIAPLARACRSWVSDAAPDPMLVTWWRDRDPRFREYLEGGCRTALDPKTAAEVDPWLDAWDLAAQAMLYALRLEEAPTDHGLAYQTAMLWGRARLTYHQVFGIRWAYYPVTRRAGEELFVDGRSVVSVPALTDLVCGHALGRVDNGA